MAFLILPSLAAAATLTRAGALITYTAAAGETNNLAVSRNPDGSYKFSDPGASIAPTGCTAVNANEADCPTSSVSLVIVNTGDQGDTVASTVPSAAIGVPSISFLTGDGADTFNGSPDNDALIDLGTGNDVANGNGGNDFIDGGTGADDLDGGTGVDTVTYSSRINGVTVTVAGDDNNDGEAGEGDSVMNVENLIGGSGNDDLRLGADPGTLNGGLGTNQLRGSPGDDRCISGPGTDSCSGFGGLDTMDYGARSENLTISMSTQGGAPGENDTMSAVERAVGGSGNDTFNGSVNGDIFVGGPGADTFNGDVGEDTVEYASRTEAIAVTAGDGLANDGSALDGPPGLRDKVTNSIESVIGGSGNDTIYGSSGSGVIEGRDGNDTLDGGLGADVVIGGSGTDTVDYSSRTRVNASLNKLADDGSADVDPSTAGEQSEGDALREDVENIVGSPGNDELSGDDGVNTIEGRDGNDSIAGGDGADSLLGGGGADSIAGNDGDDGIGGGADADDLSGGPGNDDLAGSGGNDQLDGGLGADLLTGGSGVDSVDYSSRLVGVSVTVNGTADDGEAGEADNVGSDVESASSGAGDDLLLLGAGNGTLDSGAGDDSLDGGVGADVLVGGDGNDLASYASRAGAVSASIDGAANDGEVGEGDLIDGSVENLAGGSGPDTFIGSGAANTLSGGAGSDLLVGGDGFDLLRGGEGNDLLDGSNGPDTLEAGNGDDSLVGGEGNDFLYGDAGNDSLDGGGGADDLSGGSGIDAANYQLRVGNVNSSNEGLPDDGHAGEQDNVRTDVEGTSTGSGADTINVADGAAGDVACGPGVDKVTADGADRVAGDCEFVTRTNNGVVTVTQSAITMTRKGIVRIAVGCPVSMSQGCSGRLALSASLKASKKHKKRKRGVGSSNFKVPGGKTTRVAVKLSKLARRTVTRSKRLKVRINASLGSGQATTSRTVTVRAPKAKKSKRGKRR